MQTTSLSEYKTAPQLAAEMGLHDSRIRQLCRQLGVGLSIGGLRLLSPADCDAIRATPRADTRPEARRRRSAEKRVDNGSRTR